MSLRFIDVLIGLSVVLGGLSLIVTLIVQTVGSFLALRGSNLRWGLETLLQSLDPALTPHARDIAERVLRHPLLSGSILATNDDRTWATLLGGLAMLPGGSTLLRRWTLAKAIHIDELVPILRHLAAQPVAPAGPGAGAPPVSVPPAPAWQAALQNMMNAGPVAVAQIRRWFDSAMDRVTERFATRTRIIAICASFALAIALHVDVIHIYAAVSTDTALQAKLLEVAGPMARRDVDAEDIQRVRAALAQAAKAAGLPTPPETVTTSAAAETWINGSSDAANADACRKQFRRALAAARVAAVQTEIDALTSNPVWGALDLWPLQPTHSWWDLVGGPNSLSHLLGVLFGGALLSLGAPFWFNLLKSLVSLRPQAAEKADHAH